MLTEYINAALRRAQYEILADDGTFYGKVPECRGVYANAASLEECRTELLSVLEDWILFRIDQKLPLPTIDGLELVVRKEHAA